MTNEELQELLDNPPAGLEQQAFMLRQSIAQRQKHEENASVAKGQLDAAHQAVSTAQAGLQQAMGYQQAMLDSLMTLKKIQEDVAAKAAMPKANHIGESPEA